MPHHQPQPSQQRPVENRRMTQCTEHTGSHQIVTSMSGDTKSRPDQGSCPQQSSENSASASASRSEDLKPKAQEKELKREDEEREEDTQFFSFVILHSPEDADVAGSLKEKLECLGVGTGATFNQDFAVPGQHTLSCVEDAINNSAFTILLLSRNFNARMLEFETNSALMNSIENRHKSNTVIPLLPRENRLPDNNIPRSLRIFIPLVEGSKGFESMVKKALAPARIERQRAVWRQEQEIRRQRERKERLLEDNERNADLVHESKLLQEQLHLTNRLQQQQQMLHYYQSLLFPPPGQPPAPGIGPLTPALGAYYWLTPPQPQPPSIHIQNASCIMIGNDSQMTLGTGVENPLMDNREEHTGDNM
ncbi:hypothetical protein AAFF_G00004500 [Aldrovandia affinis]|uniref:TIR domain-containing protein n=1 Tax=Aldrovandia affinis TaxID=143900 RepID=A0AAD7TDJ7_9TELE|nr:hypothetical protein AAFF_G00004500 [Aldrovandia affinis]